MIAPMKKVFVVARSGRREDLLKALRKLGAVHLEPTDPSAGAPEEVRARLQVVRRARQLLAGVTPTGEAPKLDPVEAAEEALAISRRTDENATRLASLHRQGEQLAMWGAVRLEDLDALESAGVPARFYSVAAGEVAEVRADLVARLAALPGKRVLVAVVARGREPGLPESAEAIERPPRDRPTILAEAKGIDRAMAADAARMAELANLKTELADAERRLESQIEFAAALAGGMAAEELFAVQGWVPADRADELSAGLSAASVPAAVTVREPEPDEHPPTLIRYPRWARPVKGLFDMLGTFPGYEETDLSPFFMVALPLFAAMLIGDAGYGVVFLLLPLLLYRKMAASAGKPTTHLVIVVGAVTVLWGILTANYFGVTPDRLPEGSFWRQLTTSLGVLWDADPEAARFLIIKVSFIFGCIHLISGHLRQAAGLWPDRKAVSEIGWCAVLAGMLAVVWKLFGFPLPQALLPAALGALAVGYVAAVLFAYPQAPLAKRLGLGFASSLLPLIGAFGDTMSYIRLMAVGLASYYIAAAFNDLGAMVGQMHPVLWIAGGLIIVFGHALNIGLAIIAIFAHGVRLNMLEFSGSAGVQWAGYPFQPFATSRVKED